MSPARQLSDVSSGRNKASWSEKYREKHRMQRVVDFPAKMKAPERVRLYSRRDHYILQFWDSEAKRTLSIRVDGDLIDAISEARRIESRLVSYKTSGMGFRKLQHSDLVVRFLHDLHQRANAGDVAVATVLRYESALKYYQEFCNKSEIQRSFPTVQHANRDFRLALQAWVSSRKSQGNHSMPKANSGDRLIFDTVRTMYNWASDHSRGNLLSDGFRNPFEKSTKQRREVSRDPFGEPDISTDMAVDFILACDSYQLPLFSMIILYGLRAAEPRFLFREHLEQQWLKVVCIPEIDYLTKGQRDKRFPLVPSLQGLIVNPKVDKGLIFTRRPDKRTTSSPMFGASLQECIDEFRRRCRGVGTTTALQRQTVREQILGKAGALNYDQIEHEFKNIANCLKWPKSATMKDFRHLFSTSLENAGVPIFYRRYMMGQSPGNSPIVTYTHLNELDQQYGKALQSQLKPITDAIARRTVELEL